MSKDYEDFQIRLGTAIQKTRDDFRTDERRKDLVEVHNELASVFLNTLTPISDDRHNKGLKTWIKGFVSKQDKNSACVFCGKKINKTYDEYSESFTAVPLIPISLGGKIQTENCVLSCSSCASELGERDWLSWGKARSEKLKKELLEQRLEVLMFSDNHVISFDAHRDFRTCKVRCRVLLNNRFSSVRFLVYASVVDAGGVMALDLKTASNESVFLFRRMATAFHGVEHPHPRYLMFTFFQEDALAMIQELIALNALVKRITLPNPYPTASLWDQSEHVRRWDVLLDGYTWIDDVYHHLRERKLINDYKKKRGLV